MRVLLDILIHVITGCPCSPPFSLDIQLIAQLATAEKQKTKELNLLRIEANTKLLSARQQWREQVCGVDDGMIAKEEQAAAGQYPFFLTLCHRRPQALVYGDKLKSDAEETMGSTITYLKDLNGRLETQVE